MKSKFYGLIAAVPMALASVTASAGIADVVVVVDESGSMGGEHAWIDDAIADLEAGLKAAGIGDDSDGNDFNRYALVGYGSRGVDPVGISNSGRNNDTWMSSSDFATATGSLLTNGGTEDGYDGIDYFFDKYTKRGDAALNVILVTDEDRDVYNSNATYNSILSAITGVGGLLNVVVNTTLREDNTTFPNLLGVDSDGNGYKADGSGGYDTVANASAVFGSGTTIADYVNLAFATGGAAWDLNQLRAGGNTALSFSEAFVDIKVSEIEEQVDETVPVPAPLALIGLGLLAMVARKRS